MKSLIFATVLLLSTNSAFANTKSDYLNKIVSAYQNQEPISSLIIESINKGIFSPNETFTQEEGFKYNAYLLDFVIGIIPSMGEANFVKITNDNTIALKFMLEHGLDINLKTNIDYSVGRKTSLIMASAHECNLDSVKLLVKYGANPAVNYTDPQFSPPITSESGNGATYSLAGHFNYSDYLDEDQKGDGQNICFNTFKYFVEEVKIDISKYGCYGLQTLETLATPHRDDSPSDLMLYNYIVSKYGPNFFSDCEALYFKQYKDAGWEL